MAGTPTFGALTNAADYRSFTLHLMDNSGDTWTEQLYVAIAATYAAINAWVILYQTVTQASVYGVTEEHAWYGDADPDLTDSDMRSGVENGINLAFRNANTRELRPLRVIAPITAVMEGHQDIPLLSQADMTALIVATVALESGFNFRQGQYTVHRERKNNPRVK